MSRRRTALNRLFGFSTTGIVGVVALVGFLAAFAAPRVGQRMERERLDDAGQAVAEDLRLASELAAETRKPVRLVVRGRNAAAASYAIYDRSGAVRHERSLGSGSAYGLSSVTFSTDTVEFYPNGVTSHPLTVTLSAGTDAGTRQVTMARAGYVRIQ